MKKSPQGTIDSHQHAFWWGLDDAGLVRDMDQHGIDLAWLLTWEIPDHSGHPETYADCAKVLNPARIRPDGTHPGIVLEDLLTACRNHPGRFVLGYCPDPLQPHAPQLFEAACDMYGVRVCGEWKFRLPFDDPRCLELYRAAGRRRAPVVLHLDVPFLPPAGGNYTPLWYGGTIDHLERALQACPDTVFIGHAPGFWRELYDDSNHRAEVYPEGPATGPGRVETLLARYPNLYADLSAKSALLAMKRDPTRAANFLNRHSDRLLFARDHYGTELHDFLSTLPLEDETVRRIYHENARQLVPA